MKWSYSFVRQALQQAGLVRKRRPRGRHLMRRPPRECFGELSTVVGQGVFHPEPGQGPLLVDLQPHALEPERPGPAQHLEGPPGVRRPDR